MQSWKKKHTTGEISSGKLIIKILGGSGKLSLCFPIEAEGLGLV